VRARSVNGYAVLQLLRSLRPLRGDFRSQRS